MKTLNKMALPNKLIILLLFCGLNIQQAYCQMSEKLKMHYSLINKAEMAIIDSNYQLAINLYDSAFTYKDSPFATDIYNAAICATLTLQYDKTLLYLQRVLDKGYKIQKLFEKPLFDEFFKSDFGIELIQYSHNIVYKHNIILNNQLDSLFDIDQKFRKMVNNPYEVYKDTISKIDDSNAIFIIDFINKYGFPNEDLIGLYTNLYNNTSWYIVILHNQQRYSKGKTKTDMTDLIYDALYNGEIHPTVAIHLIEETGIGSNYYGCIDAGLLKFVLDTTGMITKEIIEKIPWGYLVLKDEDKINEIRVEIGLDKINETRKKLLFKNEDKRFLISVCGGGMFIYLISNIEDYNSMIENLIIIE